MENYNKSSENSPSVVADHCNKNIGNEFLLGTWGACFLCLTENVANSSMTEVCLKDICRYFGVNSNSILLKCLQECLAKENEKAPQPSVKENYNFSVQLCYGCACIATKLSELIRQVELAKMRMTYIAQEFYKTLMSSEENIDSQKCWKIVRNKMCDNPVELRLVERLREEAMKKCCAKLQHINKFCRPKVLLHRISTPSPENVINTPKENIFITESPKDNNNDNPSTIPASVNEAASPKEVVMEHQAVIDDEIEDVQCDKVATSDDHRKMKIAKSSNPSPPAPADEASFSPNIAPETEENICIMASPTDNNYDQSIPEHTRSSVGVTELVVEQQPDSSSPIDYFHEEGSAQNSNLITSLPVQHLQIIEIGDKQQAVNVPKPFLSNKFVLNILKNYKKKIHPGNGHKCLICNQVLSKLYNAYRHIVCKHAEILFAKCRQKNVPEVAFHDLCKNVITRASMQAKSVSSEQENPGERERLLLCPFCEREFVYTLNLKYHLVLRHYQNLQEKLVQLQDGGRQDANKSSSKPVGGNNAVGKRQQYNAIRVGIKEHFKKRQQWTCGVANGGKIFSSSYNKSRHIKYHCSKRKTKKIGMCNLARSGCGDEFSSSGSFHRHKLLSCDRIKSRVNLRGTELPLTGNSNNGIGVETIIQDEATDMMNTENGSRSDNLQNHPHLPIFNLANNGPSNFQTGGMGSSSEARIVSTTPPTVSFESAVHVTRNLNEETPTTNSNNIGQNLLKQVFARHLERNTTGPNVNYHKCKCNVCGQLFNSVSFFQRHFLTDHPDMFFLQQKLQSSFSEDVFKGYCNEMIQTILDQSERLRIPPKHLACPNCNQECGDKFTLRNHLFCMHYNLLEEELVKRLNDVRTEEEETPLVITGTYTCENFIMEDAQIENETANHKCLACFKWYSPLKIVDHMANNHPENIFGDKRINNLSQDAFRECCTELFLTLEQQVITLQRGLETYILCPMCNLNLPKDKLRQHLVANHSSELEKTLMKLQQDVLSEKEAFSRKTGTHHVAGHSSTTREITRPTINAASSQALITIVEGVSSDITLEMTMDMDPHGIESTIPLFSSDNQINLIDNVQNFVRDTCGMHFERIDNTGNSKCLICNLVYGFSRIRHHIAFSHPEKFFSHRKSQFQSEKDFKECCDQVMRRATNRAEELLHNSRNIGHLLCPNCNNSFSGLYHLSYHILLKHYKLLEEELVKVQQDRIERNMTE